MVIKCNNNNNNNLNLYLCLIVAKGFAQKLVSYIGYKIEDDLQNLSASRTFLQAYTTVAAILTVQVVKYGLIIIINKYYASSLLLY